MALNRKILPKEEKLLELLVEKSSMNFPSNWKENLLVCTMQDGEMGSLQLFPHGSAKENRLFGKRISEYQFTDEDGVEVIASLNIDDNGDLLELDIWKTDFSSLKKIPDHLY